VLHDSFTRVWQSAATYDPLATRPVAWMVAIVRNRALDMAASHDVARVDPYEEHRVDTLFDWSEGADDAEDRRRSTRSLVLAYQHGLSHSELAAQLQKPLGTVKSWVRRGMANLRDCLEGVQ